MKIRHCLMGIATGTVAFLAGTATAQTESADSALQEIVVTATRRSEEISKVPISVVAIDPATIQAAGIKTVMDLANWVPGIEFDTSSGFGPNTLTNIAIRGINSNVGTSTTGIYLDDVPLQTRIVALSYWGNPLPALFDVERVEVERGPQGTLFGAGAEGGAIRFVSPEPDLQKYSGFARGDIAYTESGAPSYEGGVAVGGPISTGTVGFRASAWARRDGGYVDRVDPLTGQVVDDNANDTDSAVARLSFAIKPNDGLTITPAVFWQRVHNHDSPAYFEYLSNPADGVFKNGRLLAQPATENLWVPSLKIEGALSGAMLTSITAYMHRDANLIDDATSYNGAIFGPPGYGSPLGPQYPTSYDDAGPVYLSTKVNLFTQEIRATSDDPNARLKWTVGVFFSHASQTDTEQVMTPFYMENFFGLPGTDPLFYSQITSTDTQYAAFGQVDYLIAPKTTLTLGVRISHNIAKYEQAQSGPIASQEFPIASGEQSQTPVIPKLGLAYQATDASLLYFSAAKGYRVGGANQPIPLAPTPAGCPLPNQPGPYNGDSVWSFELGNKNRLLGGRLSLDGSIFYVDWSQIQQQIYFTSCSFGFIANTGSAESKGFDFSTRYAITEALTAGLSVSYTDAKITKTVTFDGATLVQKGDAVGTIPAVGSPWNLNAMLEYGFHVADHNAYLRAEGLYHSENPGPFNSYHPGSPLYNPTIPPNPAYEQFNARLGIQLPKLDLSVYTNNITNQHPPLGRFIETPTVGIYTDTTLRPRTYGVTATYKF
jgi:outer membrane receptor protein involved in Fe transport